MEKLNLDQRLRALAVTNAEIAECLRDLCFAINMPDDGHRVNKISGCVAGLERATQRLRYMVLGQEMPKETTTSE